MTTYLDGIVAFHRRRAHSDHRELDALIDDARRVPTCRGFKDAISRAHGLAVIAEIKRRSPSKGDLNIGLDPSELARKYESAGATCLSVLTDSEHFGGSAEDLKSARSSITLPVIRKDFTVDPRDVCDARLMGADCVLLIAAVLDDSELAECMSVAKMVGIDVLVEIHDEEELARALWAGADMVGVNQRDLVTFEVDHERAVRMGGVIPAGIVRVAESGVRGRRDAESLRAAGYDAVLVGEHLVTAGDTTTALRELLVD